MRNKVIIASKGGISLDENHKIAPKGAPKEFRKSLEQTLKRLGVETEDLYYQHRMDPQVEPETVAETMQLFSREGKIRYWGISNGSEEYIRRAHAVCPVTCVQLRHSMMARWQERLFPLLEELNIGFVAFSPLANGFLTSGSHTAFNGELDYRSRCRNIQNQARQRPSHCWNFCNSLPVKKMFHQRSFPWHGF